ncbi:MAG TPA: hypothetical protein VFT45_07810 [Longimicrobium sp.]|nr:hypothetical protein [Longimicrobium sp.]
MRIPPPPLWRRIVVQAALACIPLAPLHAQTQEPSAFAPAPSVASTAAPFRLPGTVDVGASVGVAQTSRYYDAGSEAGTVTDGTAFSAEARYWPLPWLGLRLQAGHFDGQIRTAFRPPSAGLSPPQDLRATVYDASVVVRPLAAVRAPGPLSTAYAFAGGGEARLDLSGTPDTVQVCPGDFCEVTLDSRSTVGQLTLGAGGDLLSVSGFTVFAEASLHRYRPPFEYPFAALQQQSTRVHAPLAPRLTVVGTPNSLATTGNVVTRRFAVGVRRTFGSARTPPTPPPAPPPSPTTGGVVTVVTTEPGAEVYLVPRSALEDDPGLRCRLRPVLTTGSYYRGRTTAAQPLRVPAGPRAWVLVVRQQVASGTQRIWHVHEQRIQLAGGSTVPVQLNMRRDGRPPQPCPR